MRVPVYQQQVTPNIPVERSQVSVPDGAAGVAIKPIDTTEGLTRGVESLRLGLVKLNENREQFMLASAVNEFRRANTQYLHAKDTGVFAKKGGQVFGVSGQYDEFAQKTMEDIAKKYKMSGAARDRFIGSTNALRDSSLSSVMSYEQRESDAARTEVWKATAADTLNNVLLNYNDDAAFNEEVQIGLGAVAQMWEPYGDQVVSSKMNEFMSQCQAARVGAMLEESPKAAYAYLKAHKGDFTGADFVKVQKAVDTKLDVIKVQKTTDALVKKFRGNEAAALKYVHANYEGDFENKLASAVKSRFIELEYRTHAARSARATQQGNEYKAFKAHLAGGGLLTDEMIERANVSDAQKADLRARLEKNRSFKNLFDNGARYFAGWEEMTPEQQYTAARRAAGVSDWQYAQNVLRLNELLRNNEADDADVKLWRKSGAISPKDEREALDAWKNRGDMNVKLLGLMETTVGAELQEIGEVNPAVGAQVDAAKFRFINAARGIPRDAPDYAKRLDKLAGKTVTDFVDTYLRKQGRSVSKAIEALYDQRKTGGRVPDVAWIDPDSVGRANGTISQMANEGFVLGVRSGAGASAGRVGGAAPKGTGSGSVWAVEGGARGKPAITAEGYESQEYAGPLTGLVGLTREGEKAGGGDNTANDDKKIVAKKPAGGGTKTQAGLSKKEIAERLLRERNEGAGGKK